MFELVMPLDRLKTVEADRVLVKISGAVIRADEKGMAVCFDKKYTITPVKV
jgi:hypothetical protein